MGLQINTNLTALNVNRKVGLAASRVSRGFEGLASGLRINRARDDAAGLAIAERFQAQFRQYEAETRSYQDAFNAASTAEAGMGSQADIIQRVRELAVQASSGTLSDENRAALNQEAQQLLADLDDTATRTTFNEQELLTANQTLNIDPQGNISLILQESTTASMGLGGLDLSTQGGAQNALDRLDTAMQTLDQNRASMGAQMTRYERAIENRQNQMVQTAASESMIRDLDFARSTMMQTRNNLLLRAGIGAATQANIVPQNALFLLGR